MDALMMGFILLIHVDTMEEDRGWYRTAILILAMGYFCVSIFANLKEFI